MSDSAPDANDGADDASKKRPLTIGVFGGSFNPIHLGHVLLAVTTQQTKPLDSVVLVPVFKHVRKTDLLPFEDRVAMCELAVAPFCGGGSGSDSSTSGEGGGGACGLEVSTIERDVGESNAAMLRGLKRRYPSKTKFLWICGDDVFRWIDKPKGVETMSEVSGLIVQRRLHKAQSREGSMGMGGPDRFFKEPLDEAKIRSVALRLNLEMDFIYGELPHFSSTLVRRAPGSWRSFLPQSVSSYLEERPRLLERLRENLEADAASEAKAAAAGGGGTGDAAIDTPPRAAGPTPIGGSLDEARVLAGSFVMRGLDAVHALQMERGRTGLFLSTGTNRSKENLDRARSGTDGIVREILDMPSKERNFDAFEEAFGLASELRRIPEWLSWDREVADRRSSNESSVVRCAGAEGWLRRYSLIAKFNGRVDVLIGGIIRSLSEILDSSVQRDDGNDDDDEEKKASSQLTDSPELLSKWLGGKEALGRLRAFVCAGGPDAPEVVRSSLEIRRILNQIINTKERRIERVLSLQAELLLSPETRLAAPDALHRMLEEVTKWEWRLMGCFASGTSLPLVHRIVFSSSSERRLLAVGSGSDDADDAGSFDVERFFGTTSAAIDLMLNIAKALAAFGCARV